MFLVKILPNKIYLFERSLGYKMNPSKDVNTNPDQHNMLIQILASNDKKFDDEYIVIISLN